jgi:ubiquinone/menaquinone biosynthesis C-methylase UbiE
MNLTVFLKKIKHKIDYYNAPMSLLIGLLALALTFYSTFYSPKPDNNKTPTQTLPISDNKTKTFQINSTIGFVKQNEKIFLYLIAFILFVISIVLLIKLRRKKKIKFTVFAEEGRFFRSVKDIMSECLSKNEILISSIRFTDITTVNDIKAICTKVLYPNRNHPSIEEAIIEARKKAYSIKYSTPRTDDEKIVGIDEYGNWEHFFVNITSILNIENIQNLKVLDVGVGNANTYSEYFSSFKNYIAVDLSSQALAYAKKKFNNFTIIENEAENLSDIENTSVDIYLSFRAYQSTLFDRRKSLHEARRVLKSGGLIIISLPILYYTKKEFIKGLSNSEKNITMDYAFFLANSIKQYLEMLNFNNVVINQSSPYELFIYGQLED